MRVAYDYQTFCLQSYGGISRYYVNLAEQMIKAGNDVGIFAPFHRNNYLTGLPSKVVHGESINSYPRKTARLILSINSLLCRRAIKKWQPHIVHETYYSKRRVGPTYCPSVITVYDMIHEIFDFKDATSSLKKLAVERADHVICISKSTQVDLIELLGVPEEKTTVVHLGFDKLYVGAQVRRPAQVQANRKFLLYVGLRKGYKNFSTFLKGVAASMRIKADFDVVAFGGGQFSPSEKTQIAALGFSEGQVVQISGADCVLAGCYQNASALVFPSKYEGFGLPPLEAMAHDCAVVCSSSSCIPEIAGKAAEYFSPDSEVELTHALERVLYSKERSAELVELGRQRLKQFSWEKCSYETLRVYEKIINEYS